MSKCNNYIRDSDYHLTVHCLKRGLVGSRVCMGCKNRQQSNTRNCIENNNVFNALKDIQKARISNGQ